MKYKAAYNVSVKQRRVESPSDFTLIFLPSCIRKKLPAAVVAWLGKIGIAGL